MSLKIYTGNCSIMKYEHTRKWEKHARHPFYQRGSIQGESMHSPEKIIHLSVSVD